ncbi:MAG: dihydropteroate synthase [Planctomycetota bacterium]
MTKLQNKNLQIKIMGILNITPDSFSDGGQYRSLESAVARAWDIAREGADAVDIGGESTRPGSQPISVAEELSRVVPVLEGLGKEYPIPISIDTRRAEVAAAAQKHGATLINDTSALRDDPEMAALAAERGMGVVLMHRQGTPATMQKAPHYDDLLAEVRAFFQERVAVASDAGIRGERIMLDPGLGFGKRPQDNYHLVRSLRELQVGEFPFMVGASRKSFLSRFDGCCHRMRLPGSLAFAGAAWAAGARWLRVHDVEDTIRYLETLHDLQEEPGT